LKLLWTFIQQKEKTERFQRPWRFWNLLIDWNRRWRTLRMFKPSESLENCLKLAREIMKLQKLQS